MWLHNTTGSDITAEVSDETSSMSVVIAANTTDLVLPGLRLTGSVVISVSHDGGDGELLALANVNRIA